MTDAQKIALRISQVRQRLNEISALSGADLTDEVRAEIDTLTAEYSDLEIRHQAALVGGGDGVGHGPPLLGQRTRPALPAMRTTWRGLILTLGGVVVGGYGATSGQWDAVSEFVYALLGAGAAERALGVLGDKRK